MRALAFVLFAGASGGSIWVTEKFFDYELQLVDARGEANFERERAQKLLSRGRWIRTIDEKTGVSTYRFAKQKEQR